MPSGSHHYPRSIIKKEQAATKTAALVTGAAFTTRWHIMRVVPVIIKPTGYGNNGTGITIAI